MPDMLNVRRVKLCPVIPCESYTRHATQAMCFKRHLRTDGARHWKCRHHFEPDCLLAMRAGSWRIMQYRGNEWGGDSEVKSCRFAHKT